MGQKDYPTEKPKKLDGSCKYLIYWVPESRNSYATESPAVKVFNDFDLLAYFYKRTGCLVSQKIHKIDLH